MRMAVAPILILAGCHGIQPLDIVPAGAPGANQPPSSNVIPFPKIKPAAPRK